jgi:hypothetical protein
MRWDVACAISSGCGARTGLQLGTPSEDGSVLDVTLHVAHDTEVIARRRKRRHRAAISE